MTLLEPVWAIGAAVAAGGLTALALAARRRSARQAERFVGRSVASSPAARRLRSRRWLRSMLSIAAIASAALAIARPAWDPRPRPVQQTGRDVVFLIDVSRSMLAQDLRPNRLERAKFAVGDVLDVARGDRVAIIAFAGSSVVKSPLTTDYSFARMALDELAPDSVSRGGSMIGDALRRALELMFEGDPNEAESTEERFRDIVLISDGEDQDSFAVEAAELAGRLGVRIVTIGVGDSGTGATIPVEDASGISRPLVHQGETVRTRLESETLRRVAEATPGGVYLEWGTGAIDLERVYQQLIRDAGGRELDATETMRYTEGFQALLALALLLLGVGGSIREPRSIV